MSMRDVGIQGGSINDDKQDVGGKGGGEGAEDGEEVVRNPLMCEGRDWMMGWRWKSTKAEIHSVTE